MNIKDHIRIVPGFPKPGINFYDIASLLAEPRAFAKTIEQLQARIAPHKPDMIMGIESRGFIVAAPLAVALGCKMGLVRKKGKLPGTVMRHEYTLEYGQDAIEIQPDLVGASARVALVDDLLATGGTLQAAEILITRAGSTVVGSFCIIELEGLGGRDKLTAPFESLLRCPA